jgi:DNA-binding XRE family transcriptional regulator
VAMGRPPKPPKTALGRAIRDKRGDATGDDVAALLGIDRNTLYRLERGEHGPSMQTALALAKWLGWTIEEVVHAAGKPPAP